MRTEVIQRDVNRRVVIRRSVVVALLAMLVGACGDGGLMEGLGDRSHEYVQGSTTMGDFPNGTGEAITVAPGIPIEEVSWFNEAIENETVGDLNMVVSAVWARGRAEGRFIQASPAEIAEALPGVQFPSIVPQDSEWVTSQLVYDAASATLDSQISAAFGIWSAEPYSEGDGRLAVLRIGELGPDSTLGSEPVASNADDGLTLVWSDGAFRYELQCRSEVLEDQCWEMAESLLPLHVVGPPAAASAD